MNSIVILIPLCGAVILAATAVILYTRNSRHAGGILKSDKENDFFDDWYEWMEKRLSGIPQINQNTYLAIAILGYTGVLCLFLILDRPAWQGLLAGAAGLCVPEVLIRILKKRSNKQFEDRYARALQQLASSLRSGMSIQQAVSDLCGNPFIHRSVIDIFTQIDTDLKVSISVKDAFMRAAEKNGNIDMYDVAVSIALQNQLGGSEAKVVETIARNISSRIMLRREVASQFADTNMTVLAMDIVPVLIIGGLMAGSPDYMAPFFETTSMTAVFIGIIMYTFIGSVVIRRSINRGIGG